MAKKRHHKSKKHDGFQPGYSMKEVENYGEFSGKENAYKSIEVSEKGPLVTDGLQNHNHRILEKKRVEENTDYVDKTIIGKERQPREFRQFDPPKEHRIYELPLGKWPRPKEDIKVIKKVHDDTYKPPTPLKEMTPFPDESLYNIKTINYTRDPYEHTANTNYLTGAKVFNGLNNSRYDRPAGMYAPEQYEEMLVKRNRDKKKDTYYVDTRRYIKPTDDMTAYTPYIKNPYTPFSRKSNVPTSRMSGAYSGKSIPATVRKTFG